MMTESDVKTVTGISYEECKEKLWKEYRHDYKIIDQKDDFENYGPFHLFRRPIKVVRYVPYRKSYNPDNYFIHNRTEEDELEQNRQAILQANNTTLLTSQIKEMNKTMEEFKKQVTNELKSYSHSMSDQHETITKIQEILQQNEFSFSYIKIKKEVI